MTTTTTNLALVVYNLAVDGTTLTYTYINDISGSASTSNMNKIDTFAGQVSGSIGALQTSNTQISGSIASLTSTVNALPAITGVASIAEVSVGTETSKYISPDALAGSLMGTKTICKLKIGGVVTGTGYMYIPIPEWAWRASQPWELIDVEATVDTVGSANMTVQLFGSATILSTAMTVEANELTSKDATTAAVINASYKSLSSIKRIRVDPTVSGTAPENLTVMLSIRRP